VRGVAFGGAALLQKHLAEMRNRVCQYVGLIVSARLSAIRATRSATSGVSVFSMCFCTMSLISQ
jgi:hypothetical protein